MNPSAENTYPGAACDVNSHLYSFSFALKPDWTRICSPAAEIRTYMEDVAQREGVLRHARLGTAVTGVTWDDAQRIWHVSFRDVASGREGRLTARFVVSCVGGLHVPRPPDIPGVGSFGGPIIHTAKWDASVDLRGRTVAIIGTGASCVQASGGRA